VVANNLLIFYQFAYSIGDEGDDKY